MILLEGSDYNYKLSDSLITFQFIIEPQKKCREEMRHTDRALESL